ncbi:MAG: hypothetical protein HQL63_09580, partial [Magnetococcales bacterium]|nr:hypothetical protein [Magnetococcales bacterium]
MNNVPPVYPVGALLALLLLAACLLSPPADAAPSRALSPQEEQMLERQVWLRINQMAMDPTANADALVEPVTILVDLYLEQGRHAKAEPVLQMAINQLSGKSSAANAIPLLRLTSRMAKVDLAYGRFELASRQFNLLLTASRAKEAFTPAQEQDIRLSLARTRVGMALALADQSARLSRSSQLLMVAIPELAQYLGEKHPEVLAARIQYLDLLARQGYFDQVREESAPLLTIFLAMKPPRLEEMAQIYRFRGWALAQGGNIPAALESLNAGLHLLPAEYMGALQFKARLLVDLAVVYLGDRRNPEALSTFERLEDTIVHQFGRGSFKQARLLQTISLILEKQGMPEDAQRWRKKAFTLGQAIFDKETTLLEKWWSALQTEINKGGSVSNPLEMERQLSDLITLLFTQVENMASWRERLPSIATPLTPAALSILADPVTKPTAAATPAASTPATTPAAKTEQQPAQPRET